MTLCLCSDREARDLGGGHSKSGFIVTSKLNALGNDKLVYPPTAGQSQVVRIFMAVHMGSAVALSLLPVKLAPHVGMGARQ